MTLHPIVSTLLPEAALILTAMFIVIAGLSQGRLWRTIIPEVAVAGLILALICTVTRPVMTAVPVASLRVDALSQYVRAVVFVLGIIIVLVNQHVPAREDRGEYFALLLLSLAGISLVSVADDLLLLFLALELVSIPTYIMIALSRDSDPVREAACKYFFLGSFAAAISLYGFSFIYGIAGSTSLSAISLKLAAAPTDLMLRLALLLSLASLAFKVAAVPFHAYVPDVYQGAAAALSGSLGFIPKMAGFVALMRVFDLVGWRFDPSLFWALWVVAAVTMTVGNTLALMQNNVKRALAYSSIAHSGYMLVALLAGPGGDSRGALESPFRSGPAAVLFYMAIYGVMNLGAFSFLAYFRSRATNEPVQTFDELGESARAKPLAGLGMALCAVGLMGLPPTAGLLGKMYLFSSALSLPASSPYRVAMIVLVVIGVVNAAIAAVYYLRIVSACTLGERRSDAPAPTHCNALLAGMAICALFVIAAFFWPNIISDRARTASLALQRRTEPPRITAEAH